ncbi:glyoxylate/hydroxypyruvate reductase A [Roseateles sp.]|uniref:2-hydroxyacid dehydrogenase n=1 Tax=Roseateles sp. TaxID=1971397 RepID=UPI0031DC848E
MSEPVYRVPFVADAAAGAGWVPALRAAMPELRIAPLREFSDAELAQCEVAIVANPSPADLRRMPRLKWVQSVWAGVERLVADLSDAGDAELRIVRLVDPQLAETMAEAVLAWTLYLHRDMPAYARQQQARQWRPIEYVKPRDKTVGLLGLGALGDEAAKRLQSAGFRVEGWSRSLKSLPGVLAHSGEEGLSALLGHAEILVCLLPLTPETRGLLNETTFARMKPNASLINFARGAIVDDEALRRALDAGRLGHAVLDVFAVEPLPEDSWHWHHPAVTVLPHISGPTDRGTASAIVAANIRTFRVSGKIPPHVHRERGY